MFLLYLWPRCGVNRWCVFSFSCPEVSEGLIPALWSRTANIFLLFYSLQAACRYISCKLASNWPHSVIFLHSRLFVSSLYFNEAASWKRWQIHRNISISHVYCHLSIDFVLSGAAAEVLLQFWTMNVLKEEDSGLKGGHTRWAHELKALSSFQVCTLHMLSRVPPVDFTLCIVTLLLS